MTVDTRLTYSLGRDQAGRFIQFVVDGPDRFELKRAGGGGVHAASIQLSADQLRDMCAVALK